MKPPEEAAAPRALDFIGERVRPPDSAPYLDPSFSNTAPPSQTPQHDEDWTTRIYFGHFSPLNTLILLFILTKSLPEAWRHAHCVCRLLFPPQYAEFFFFAKPYSMTTLISLQCSYSNIWQNYKIRLPKGNCDMLKLVKGIVHPKMKITPWFNQPQAILGVYNFLLSDAYNQSIKKRSWLFQAL